MYGNVTAVYGDKNIVDDFVPQKFASGSWDDIVYIRRDLPDFGIINTTSTNDQIPMVVWGVENSFTQVNVSQSEENQVNRLLLFIKISNEENWANRLYELHNTAKEDDPDYIGISSESLNNLNTFLQRYRDLKLPKITLTPEHNIYISWKNDNFLFSIHFLPKRKINFVLFMTNEEHPDKKDRLTGTATVDSINELIPHDILNDWIRM